MQRRNVAIGQKRHGVSYTSRADDAMCAQQRGTVLQCLRISRLCQMSHLDYSMTSLYPQHTPYSTVFGIRPTQIPFTPALASDLFMPNVVSSVTNHT
jgi:hypothetical protein